MKRYRFLVKPLRKLVRHLSPEDTILLDYPVRPKQRWNFSKPHEELFNILNTHRNCYIDILNSFLQFIPNLLQIKKLKGECTTREPFWINGWMPALDGVALYSFLALKKPNKYIEIGSGNSTKFAYRSKLDNQLKTEIISIDPQPRDEINDVCTKIIRSPIEDVNIDLFSDLRENDILYIDNSHRALMNSDVTVVFLEIIPRLRQGVIVEIHDITLPYDYPEDWKDRYYSEQYLLASYLLAKGKKFEIILPSYFVSYDRELKDILKSLWDCHEMQGVETHGCSFWLRIL